MVGKVAKAFGKTARELAPYGGYPVLPSEGEGDRLARAAIINPRETKALDDLRRLSPRDQDTGLSMLETWIKLRKDAESEPETQ